MKDPAFLERSNMEVVDTRGQPGRSRDRSISTTPAKYRFRQRPGTSNSLGLVKFMFPNQFNVYLHDTPADSLFARASRSLSHGCVRLEQPEKLAEYVLRDQPEWTPERIAEAMHAAPRNDREAEDAASCVPWILDGAGRRRRRGGISQGRLRHRSPADREARPSGSSACGEARERRQRASAAPVVAAR